MHPLPTARQARSLSQASIEGGRYDDDWELLFLACLRWCIVGGGVRGECVSLRGCVCARDNTWWLRMKMRYHDEVEAEIENENENESVTIITHFEPFLTIQIRPSYTYSQKPRVCYPPSLTTVKPISPSKRSNSYSRPVITINHHHQSSPPIITTNHHLPHCNHSLHFHFYFHFSLHLQTPLICHSLHLRLLVSVTSSQ